MFQIPELHEFTWPVTVRKPVDGGNFESETFTGRFKIIEQSRADQLVTDGAAEEFFIGWGEDVAGADGKPLPVTEANKALLLNIPYVKRAVHEAYLEAVVIGKGPEKNSRTRRGRG